MNLMNASYIVLWLLVLTLSVFVINLSKKPSKVLAANQSGLPVGARFPKFEIHSVNKQLPFSVVYPEGKETILLFSSLRCAICDTVYPLLFTAEQKYKLKTQVIMESKDDKFESIIQKIEDKSLNAPVYALTQHIKEEVKLAGFPFAYYLSADGKVLSKGVTTSFADIDLLVRQGRRVAARKLAG